MSDEPKTPFWNTFAGLITAIAALITAIGGVIALWHGNSTQVEPGPAASQAAAPTAVRPSHPTPKPESASQAASTPLLEDGNYELYTWNGPRQKNGLLLHLRKVTDDRYIAEFSSPSEVGYTWAGELQRKQNSWSITISTYTPGNPPWAGNSDEMPGGRFNPSGTPYDIIVEGPLVTFRGSNSEYVWKKKE
jgi:hypothetical protein